MSRIFLYEITQLYSYLFKDYAFQLSKDIYDQDNFGNSCIILKSDDFQIRFVKERSQTSVDIGSISESGDWYDLNLIVELISKSKKEKYCFEPYTLEQLADFLRLNYSMVKEIFRKENFTETKNIIECIEKQRTEKMFMKFFKMPET